MTRATTIQRNGRLATEFRDRLATARLNLRVALKNAVSVASLLLLTEATMVQVVEPTDRDGHLEVE
jgi:hypothetical protein